MAGNPFDALNCPTSFVLGPPRWMVTRPDVTVRVRGPGWCYDVAPPEAVAYPIAGHAGSCDKVTRAQTHGTFDGACSCGREPKC